MKTVSFEVLYHVGTLNPAHKYAQGASLEGKGLSVSEVPDAWRGIARLSGPCWALTRPGNAFIDAHRLTRAQWRAITTWATAEGWLQNAYVWEWSAYDDEWDTALIAYANSREEALREVDGDETAVRRVKTWVATPKLNGYLGFKAAHLVAKDLALTVYAEQATTLDGVYWHDDLDPGRYSAPRAVIVPRRIADWTLGPAEFT